MMVPRDAAGKTIEQSVVVGSDEYARWVQQTCRRVSVNERAAGQ